MFNALNGLGGAGQLSSKASTDSNTALYSTFAVVGFLAGSIVNRLGIKMSLGLGGLGYSVYVSAYLCFNFTSNIGYIIFAGLLLGICAGILWAAQGAIMMSYPPERLKGRYIAWFWMIFNLGGVIGALVCKTAAARALILVSLTFTLGPTRPKHTQYVRWYCEQWDVYRLPRLDFLRGLDGIHACRR